MRRIGRNRETDLLDVVSGKGCELFQFSKRVGYIYFSFPMKICSSRPSQHSQRAMKPRREPLRDFPSLRAVSDTSPIPLWDGGNIRPVTSCNIPLD